MSTSSTRQELRCDPRATHHEPNATSTCSPEKASALYTCSTRKNTTYSEVWSRPKMPFNYLSSRLHRVSLSWGFSENAIPIATREAPESKSRWGGIRYPWESCMDGCRPRRALQNWAALAKLGVSTRWKGVPSPSQERDDSRVRLGKHGKTQGSMKKYSVERHNPTIFFVLQNRGGVQFFI